MSISFADKIKLIRSTLNLSQDKFAKLTGISLSSIKRYEGDGYDISYSALQKLVNSDECQKYALWLISDKTAPESGQIAPGDIEPEQTRMNDALSQEDFDNKFIKITGDLLLMVCHMGWFTPDVNNKKAFDDTSTLILKDVRSLMEGHYQTSSTAATKSA
jgi:transcriptional regulator with XRE-family HTH domain